MTTDRANKKYRKLRVLLNSRHPGRSRVIDAETGDEVLVSDVQITVGRSTKMQLQVQLTLEIPGFEIALDEPDDPFRIAEIVP